MTHQGSLDLKPDVSLVKESADELPLEGAESDAGARATKEKAVLRCNRCNRICGPFARLDFGEEAERLGDSKVEMKITAEVEAEIVRLFHAEKWKQGTIAKQFGLHHSTIHRVLARNNALPAARRTKKSKSDAFIPFIQQTLEKFPKLNATRLHCMIAERGYDPVNSDSPRVEYDPLPKGETDPVQDSNPFRAPVERGTWVLSPS